MHSMEMVYGLPKFAQSDGVCTNCLMAKQTRKSFPTQTNYRAKLALELVHADLCGPISPATTGENRYFLLLIDDYSRWMWVYMLKSKDQAMLMFKRFKAHVEKGTDKRVKMLRTDRGGEFCSQEFKNFCDDHGIARQYTAPYTSQQNGVVERRNRTVVAMGRSLLKQMELPLVLWGEAIRHAVYLLNRLPTRSMNERTPYEAWKGEKPNISHVKVFGCLAHMKTTGTHIRKLDDRSRVVVHLGNESGTKAYRLYDPESNSILVSRDVVFEEGKTWKWSEVQKMATKANQQRTFTVVGGLTETDQTGENLQNTNLDQEGSVLTPQSQSSVGNSESESIGDNSEPRRFRTITDLYNDTEVTDLDDELLLMGVDEPRNYKQATTERNWREAMQQEINSIEQNDTWKLTELPAGSKVIGLKWVYKIKRDANGEIIKYKARLVAKGYVQEKGVDFDEIFAPVTRIETVRLLLALAAKHGWEVHHLDVKTAFLNGELQEDVYVVQPEGFVKKGQEHLVYKLIKALYGLRQAPRAWYAKLNKSLEDFGFVRCPHEHAVYIKRT